jgi:hypothetical protein
MQCLGVIRPARPCVPDSHRASSIEHRAVLHARETLAIEWTGPGHHGRARRTLVPVVHPHSDILVEVRHRMRMQEIVRVGLEAGSAAGGRRSHDLHDRVVAPQPDEFSFRIHAGWRPHEVTAPHPNYLPAVVVQNQVMSSAEKNSVRNCALI